MASNAPDVVARPAGKRGPKTAAGKARSARNALKHGMRAAKYPVLSDESPAEFAAHEAALLAELAPVGVLQTVLARRVASAAWRLARADRIEADLFKERRFADCGPGLCLIRDGNSTRSLETLLRYRGAAMAEFARALRTLKELQAEQAKPVAHPPSAALALAPPAARPAARRIVAKRARPNEPERGHARLMEYALPEPPMPGRALHEPAVPWLPNETRAARRVGAGACAPDRPGAAVGREDACGLGAPRAGGPEYQTNSINRSATTA